MLLWGLHPLVNHSDHFFMILAQHNSQPATQDLVPPSQWGQSLAKPIVIVHYPRHDLSMLWKYCVRAVYLTCCPSLVIPTGLPSLHLPSGPS